MAGSTPRTRLGPAVQTVVCLLLPCGHPHVRATQFRESLNMRFKVRIR
jgi:hypothetical protein